MVAFLCVLMLLAAIGVIYTAQSALFPPKHIELYCPPPAEVTGNGCYKTVVITIGTTQTTQSETAGGIYNGTG